MSNTIVDILSDLLKIKHEKLIMDLLPSVCDSFQPYKEFMEHIVVRERYDITTYYKGFKVDDYVENLDLSLLYDDFIKACYESGDESVKKLLILFVFMSCLSNYNEKSLLKGVYESIMKGFKSERKIYKVNKIESVDQQNIAINNINNTYLSFVLKKGEKYNTDYKPLEKLALIHITSKVSADNVIKWEYTPPTLDAILDTNIETPMENNGIYSFILNAEIQQIKDNIAHSSSSDTETQENNNGNIYSFISWYYKNPQNKVYNFVYNNTFISKNFKLLRNLLSLLMLFSFNEHINKVKEILNSNMSDDYKISELKKQEFVKLHLINLLKLINSKKDILEEKAKLIQEDSTFIVELNTITNLFTDETKLNHHNTSINKRIIKVIKEYINIYQIKSKYIKDIKNIKDVNNIKIYLTNNIAILSVLQKINIIINEDKYGAIKPILNKYTDIKTFLDNTPNASNYDEDLKEDINTILKNIMINDNYNDILKFIIKIILSKIDIKVYYYTLKKTLKTTLYNFDIKDYYNELKKTLKTTLYNTLRKQIDIKQMKIAIDAILNNIPEPSKYDEAFKSDIETLSNNIATNNKYNKYIVVVTILITFLIYNSNIASLKQNDKIPILNSIKTALTKINIEESIDVLTSIEKVLQDDTTSTLFFHILSSE